MGTFSTKKTLYGPQSLIPQIAERIQEEFQNEGYTVKAEPLIGRGYDLSITKGGMFKAVLGMKTALKVTLLPQESNILFEAGVGIWGQQAIPTVISMLFFWPVLITQIWGIVEQVRRYCEKTIPEEYLPEFVWVPDIEEYYFAGMFERAIEEKWRKNK